MSNVHHLARNVSAAAFNKDGTKLALSPNTHEIIIYGFAGGKWSQEGEPLAEHDQLVTGIDWSPQKNRIVSTSEDRNAYVWELQNGKWMPTLVILRINRAGYAVKWSPKEDKFCVSSGSKVVSVCYFEDDHDWWVSKHIKKHKSTVLYTDWHPNNILVVTGSSDYKCRIFSAFVKGVDQKPGAVLGFGERLPFGELLLELDLSDGWVKQARWSPSGNQIAWVSHDSAICFADVTQKDPKTQKIKHKGLPFQCLVWTAEDAIVAAGHECTPFLFKKSGQWSLAADMDKSSGGAAPAKGPAQSSAMAARNMFASKVERGQDESKDVTLKTKHQNTITGIELVGSQVVTWGQDGQLVFWKKP